MSSSSGKNREFFILKAQNLQKNIQLFYSSPLCYLASTFSSSSYSLQGCSFNTDHTSFRRVPMLKIASNWAIWYSASLSGVGTSPSALSSSSSRPAKYLTCLHRNCVRLNEQFNADLGQPAWTFS